jgi:UDP-glucose 4-epimerase
MEYAVAKMAAETMLLNTDGLDVRIIRPFNVAGPRQREEGGFVLPRFIRQAKAGEPLTVYQPGSQRRAFTHVVEAADAIRRAGTLGKPGQVYNIGNPANACSIARLAEEVVDALGSSSTVKVVDPVTLWGPAFAEAPDKLPTIDKAVKELGWEPRLTRRQVILDAAA